ncbi:hypothetical protein GX408_08595 [bacterium]|nr:hypothetical protein [bacterium]
MLNKNMNIGDILPLRKKNIPQPMIIHAVTQFGGKSVTAGERKNQPLLPVFLYSMTCWQIQRDELSDKII